MPAGAPSWYRYDNAQQVRQGGAADLPRFREQQRQALGRAMASGDLTEARRIARGLIAEDGVLSRDVMNRRQLDVLIGQQTSAATGARASHGWGGQVMFASDIPLQRAGRWLEAGGPVGAPYHDGHTIFGHNGLARAVNTLVHEELLGCSPFTPFGYSG